MNSSNTLKSRLAYSSGFLGLFLIGNALLSMILYRYDPGTSDTVNAPILLSSAFVGFAIFLGRLFGALSQPLVGYWSDQFASAWGRRRPFLAISIIPITVAFSLIFLPPLENGRGFNAAYLIVLLCIFYQSFAVYQVSYLAWLTDHAETPEQRILLSTFMAISSVIGTLIAGVLTPWLTYQYGFKNMVLVIATISLVALFLPLSLPEKPTTPQANKKLLVWQIFQESLCDSTFRSYAIGISTSWISIGIMSICSAFIAVALLNQSVGFTALVNGSVLLGAISGFPFVFPLARRYGKKRTFQISMLWSGLGLVILAVSSFFVLPQPYLLLELLTFSSLGLAGFYILPNAMLPDILGENTHNDRLQQATYFGVRGLLAEFSIGLGSLLAGLTLAIGNTSENPLGIQMAIFTAGIFALMSVLAFRGYKIRT
jgi:GPH family glycoside/pentoside/hexuronide:cation symporter